MVRTTMLTTLFVLAACSLAPLSTAADPRNVYRARRNRLVRKLPPDTLAVLFGARKLPLGTRQRPSFHYLTGVLEEGAALVLAPTANGHRSLIFLAPRDPEKEQWTGRRLSIGNTLRRRLGFLSVHRTTDLKKQLARLTSLAKTLTFLGPIVPADEPVPPELRLYRKLVERAPGLRIVTRAKLLEGMRVVKDAHELGLIRRATEITIAAHFEAWRALRPGITERDVQRRLEATFLREGADGPAYPSIVGAGAHATVLHAASGPRRIGATDLVVIDAGARYRGYASDVTRTVPASGRFTPEQRKIYEIVLDAQRAALAQVRPGADLRSDVHAAARRVIAKAGYAGSFPHGTSHFVGLKVHDTPAQTRLLEPGMVLTVEPGVYLPAKGLGVRIEDTVVVTKGGYENLSARLPKTPDAIEKWLANARRRKQ